MSFAPKIIATCSRQFAIAAIITICLGVYLNTLSNHFVYDDVRLLMDNALIRDISQIPDIFLSQAWDFEGKTSNYYRPLAFLIYMIDFHLFGLDPWGYHMTSMLLHAGVSILVFLLASVLMPQIHARHTSQAITEPSGQVVFPLIAGLLFATHPIHSEPVMWISGIMDLLCSLFYLLAFITYIKAKNTARNILAPVFFFIACLGKEPALTLPIMLLTYDAVVRQDVKFSAQGLLELLKRYSPFILVALVYFAMRTNAIGEFAPVQRHQELGAYGYFINIFPLFAEYLGKLVLPVNLNVYHVFHPITSLLSVKGLVGIAATLCYISACVRLVQTNRVLAFCLVWIAIPLLPVMYIPALGENTFTERYLYLPSVGFVILVSTLGSLSFAMFREVSAVKHLPILSLLLLAGLYVFGTISRAPVWENNLTLWSDVVRKSPSASTAHNNLASALFHERRFEDAIEELKIAIRLNPANADAHDGLGAAYFNLGRIRESIDEHKEAVKLNPQNSRTHMHLGLAYKEAGALNLAISELQESLRIRPHNKDALFILGQIYADMGNWDKSITQYRLALAQDMQYADVHYALGVAYERRQMLDMAQQEFESVIAIQPNNVNAYVGLGSTLGKMGKLEPAIEVLKSALSIYPSSIEAHYNLGIAYNKTGELKLAMKEFEKLLELQPDHAIAQQVLRSIEKKLDAQPGNP